MEQESWLSRLQKGDEDAYRFFFEEYYQILGAFAIKYVKQKEVAEDIVNDVVMELYSRKPYFENVTALKSFLFLSIKNRSLNWLRSNKAQSRYIRINSPEQEERFFLDNIIEEEVYFLLKNAICILPELPREIYKLSLQGLSNEEIARELSLTVDSVKAYKKRGKQMLKEKLKGLMFFLSVGL